jgi:hypothetical protein
MEGGRLKCEFLNLGLCRKFLVSFASIKQVDKHILWGFREFEKMVINVLFPSFLKNTYEW